MAAPLTADRLLAALRAEGLKVIEVPGWRTNNRNHVGEWGPVHGVMLHHTVTPKTMSAVPMCRDGISGLPGPLAHAVIRRDGSVHLVGHGRANHAGGGDPSVLQAVKDERYTTRPPTPHEHQGSDGAVDGNPHFYGAECENLGDGKDPWPAVQVEAMVRFSAAITRAHRAKGDDWGSKSTIGHLEWSDWKSDPRWPDNVVSMPGLRTRIAERLAHAASWNPGTTPPKPPPTPTPPRTTVTVPHITHLTRPEDLTLIPGSPATIYWTGEFADEPNQHGDGGKTVLTDASYWGRLALEFTGLEGDEYLEVRVVEEAIDGGAPNVGDAAEVDGRGTGTTLVKRFIPVAGEVAATRRVTFQVTNQGASPVTLSFARLMLLSEPQ